MTNGKFRPVLYLKKDCPFCFKVRLFLLETGMTDAVDIRLFVSGSPEEQVVRAQLEGRLEKISFPAAEFSPSEFVADSDAIVSTLRERAGPTPAALPIYDEYLSAAFGPMMSLFQENRALKAALEANG